MAKRSHPPKALPAQPHITGVAEVKIEDILPSAKDVSGPVVYANHVQFVIGQNEINIDFYRIEPKAGRTLDAQALFIQRAIIPIGMGKGFVAGLGNAVARFEKANNITLPNQRGNDPEDILKIWD